MKYKTPEEYFFRIHHIRPRFKNDIENVLIYVATEISKLEKMSSSDFKAKLNERIKMYPGNIIRTEKTINNWRTEISALFGFIEFDPVTKEIWPGAVAIDLSKRQDLVRFFKYFLFRFQYPGGHLKPKETLEMIRKGIKFNPARCVLEILKKGEDISGGRFYISKAELTHCAFNDLRVTAGRRNAEEIAKLIIQNRESSLDYDWSGDVVRYAGDILDYMSIANLLTIHGNKYFINWAEREAVTSFLQNNTYFKPYEEFYRIEAETIQIAATQHEWFSYVNSGLTEELFKTDVLEYLGIKGEEIPSPPQFPSPEELPAEDEKRRTKEIGDIGEGLSYGHECMRLKIGNRSDLIRLVKRIPTAFAVGYDIQSMELDERKRYIEVKSSISSKTLNFYNFHLTPNEWGTAETLGERYFVYRLIISKEGVKLLVVQDPVGKYKNSLLQMVPREGADIICKQGSGVWEKFLIWQD